MKKRFFLLFVMVGLLVTLASCAASNKYVKLTLSEDYYEVYKGQTLEILPIVNKGSAVGDVTIEYSSYDETIATYVNGNLQGVEYGETIIKVVYAGNATICDVAKVKVVEHDLASEVGVEDTAISFYETDTYQINYTAASEAVYTFESSNEDVATVDANGLVTAALNGAQHNDGKAVITVTASDLYGAVEDQVFTVEVTVKEAHFAITLDLAGGAIAGEYANEYDIHALPHVLPTPEKDGYDFAGWLGADGEVVYEVPAGSEAALSYTAKWTERVYNISYDLDGGALPEGAENPATYDADEEVTLVAPEKVGHTFAGWEADGVKFETFPSDAYKDLAVKALWTVNTYVITYETNGATTNENETEFTYGVGYELVDAVKVGYTFLGWYDAAEEGNKVTAIAADVAKDVTLYAYWQINEYVIRFYEGEGTQVPNITLKITDEAYDLTAEEYIPVLEGHTFKGWYKDFKCEGELVNEIPSGTHEEYTLYAKWEANTYKVTYNTNGATTNENAAEYVYGKGLTLADPVKVGYTFKGWYEDEACAATPITTIAADRAEDVTVYAKWEIITYTVTFDAAGGEAVDTIEFTIESETFELPETTRKGYAFVGWFDAEEVEYEAVESGSNASLALVAKWDANDYNVTYNTNGATTNENPAIYEFGTGLTLADPVKVGYTFKGWYEDEACAATPITTIAADRAEDVTVYAKWEIITYTVTFDAAGGEAVDTIEFTIESETLELKSTTRKGYDFVGWFTAEDKELTEVVSGTTGNIALVAKWEANTHKVEYVLDGGVNAEANPSEFAYDEEVALEDATKVGYTFKGWYSDAELKEPVAKIALNTDADVKLYAKWAINQYTITYVDGEKTLEVQTYDYAAKVVALADPAKEGHTFNGWDVTVPATMPAENLTIKATWKTNKYTITYNTDGGSTVAGDVVEYGAEIKVPANPTKLGHIFAGWDKAIPATMPAENLEFKALWTVNQYTITYVDGEKVIATDTFDFAEEVVATANPEKDYYDFAGWKQTVPATMPAEDLTIEATWTPTVYKIEYVNVPETATNANPVSYTYESEEITLVDLVAEHYEFLGWFADEALTIDFAGIPAQSNGDVKVYCSVEATKYDIVYHLPAGAYFETQGNTEAKVTKYEHAQEVVLETPTLPGYKFAGWYANEELTGDAVTKIEVGSYGTQNFYPKWDVREYTISFVVEPVASLPATNAGAMYSIEGVVAPESIKFTIESPEMNFDPLTAEGYEFVGWFFVNEGQLVKLTGNFLPGNQHGNISFYALWKEAPAA